MILNQTRQELDYLFSHRHLLSDQEAIDLAKCLEILGPEIEEEDTKTEAERLKRSFKYFFMKAWPHVEDRKLVMGWHIEMMCDHLQALHEKKVLKDGREMTDLLINVPPGFSKSVCVSVIWPAWVWACQPDATFFCASYSDKLSKRDSQKTRRLMRSTWYQRYFGIEITTDTAEFFATTGGGWRWASTPGGFGTGEHFTHLIIDDALNAKKAESKAEREFVNVDWWDLTMSTRGLGLGRVTCGVMQRFHKNDWAGHYMDTNPNVVNLCLPMRYELNKDGTPRMKDVGLGVDPRKEPGELLDPVRYPEEAVRAAERQMGTYGAAGQFQQRPTSRDGAIFKTGNIQFVDMDDVPDVSAMTRYVRGWDRAGTKNAGDYSVGVLMGLYEPKGEQARVYILHVARGQWSGAEVQKQVRLFANMDVARFGAKASTWIEREPGSSGKTVAEATMAEMIGLNVRCESPTGSKEVRAEPFAVAMENWQVYVVNDRWTAEYVDEHAIFNKGDNDDQVDASSLAFTKLTRPGFYDLPDDEPGEPTAYDSFGPCKNNLCDRLASGDSPYCCKCCQIIHVTKQDIREIDDAHDQMCNHRHGTLAREGEWQPSGNVVR